MIHLALPTTLGLACLLAYPGHKRMGPALGRLWQGLTLFGAVALLRRLAVIASPWEALADACGWVAFGARIVAGVCLVWFCASALWVALERRQLTAAAVGLGVLALASGIVLALWGLDYARPDFAEHGQVVFYPAALVVLLGMIGLVHETRQRL